MNWIYYIPQTSSLTTSWFVYNKLGRTTIIFVLSFWLLLKQNTYWFRFSLGSGSIESIRRIGDVWSPPSSLSLTVGQWTTTIVVVPRIRGWMKIYLRRSIQFTSYLAWLDRLRWREFQNFVIYFLTGFRPGLESTLDGSASGRGTWHRGKSMNVGRSKCERRS